MSRRLGFRRTIIAATALVALAGPAAYASCWHHWSAPFEQATDEVPTFDLPHLRIEPVSHAQH